MRDSHFKQAVRTSGLLFTVSGPPRHKVSEHTDVNPPVETL